VRVLWMWSKPTRTRRVAGALVAAGSVAIIAFFWVLQLRPT
jgi:hypothetical protein